MSAGAMKRAGVSLAALAAMTACATAEPELVEAPIAVPFAADESLAKKAGFDGAMKSAEERQRVFDDPASSVILTGGFVQGGLLRGQTLPGAKATLDGEPIPVSADGKFLIGFGRDHGASALLVVTLDDGSIVRRAIDVADREFKIEKIDGLDQSKVSGFTAEQLAKIAVDKQKKSAARASRSDDPMWATDFAWPVTGRISGVFGSQRILNGEPQNMHGGVDVAAPAGTPIKAPAPGVVRLAEPDMYFEGGLVFLDHGQKLESAFMHLSRLDVKPGDRVEKGQVIGAVGATGRATGPHMHWSLKWAESLVDPQLVVGEMPSVEAKPAAGGN
ncbi:MAG: M23 family metallopeptidase [Parvularculaceae bacterium]|nr:M23 family metallopeptidase [Parvularculaceae bacterium]